MLYQRPDHALCFGQILRNRRAVAGVARRRIATLLGLTEHQIHLVEIGAVPPLSDEKIALVATHLKLDASTLLEAAERSRAAFVLT